MMLGKNLINKDEVIKSFIIENKDSLYRVAYSYMKNKEDSLDAVQDTIYKALSNTNKLKDIYSVKPWIYKILINTCINNINKNKKVVDISLDKIEEINVEYDNYSNIDLQRALDSLSPEYKSVIILRYFEDLKIKEISKILNKNENTIKTRLYSALEKLKIKME